MLEKESNKDLYEGKFFYEIVKPKSGGIQLFGPFDNLYYTTNYDNGTDQKPIKYIFAQVIDGRAVQAFTEQEILVTDRKL